MIQLKRLITLGICILGIFSLIGCGEGQKKLEQNSDKVNQNINLDVEQEENVSLQYITVPREEILSANIWSNSIQFGGEIFEFPCTVQALLDKGALISDEYTESALVEAGSKKSVDFKFNGIECSFTCKNKSDTERTTLVNCIVSGVSRATAEGVFFAKGVTIGMTLEELTEKWGKASSEENRVFDGLILGYSFEVYEHESGFIAPAEYRGYAVIVKPETGKITRIQPYE